ncbi:hypothetical protein [Pleurochrysis sp. endemic virus 1b]|nr:hypothetical protein [Pleurochrysis sp. endemic virus 1b]
MCVLVVVVYRRLWKIFPINTVSVEAHLSMSFASCDTESLDVFVTKPDTGLSNEQRYVYDDKFCCTVQSVRINPVLDDLNLDAIIVPHISDWIMPTWSVEYADVEERSNLYAQLKPGDLIRVGNAATAGSTKYMTVLEVREVDRLFNGTSYALPITKSINVDVSTLTNTVTLTANEANQNYLTTSDDATNSYIDFKKFDRKAGIAHIAIRVNASLNCTLLPENIPRYTKIKEKTVDETNAYDADVVASLAVRNLAILPITTSQNNPFENAYYPLYTTEEWDDAASLNISLDNTVKQCTSITLVGYSLTNKRQVGVQHSHEMQSDDYLILRIKQLEGRIVSNNRFANGAFAIIPTGFNSTTGQTGAQDHARFDHVEGIATLKIREGPHQTRVRNLTIDVLDRFGQPAYFGRLHLWFKLNVTRG